MEHYYEFKYVKMNGEDFFTIVLLPQRNGSYPCVVCRSPYVKNTVTATDDSVALECYNNFRLWLDRGYAVVFQHCRGQGKSSGAFVPYVYEREDGLELRAWIRSREFYNGELYLLGASYTASLHYATAPFEEDIYGAVFDVQDSERYRLWYRNGQMRKGHANWHFGLYKDKSGLDKRFDMRSFSQLPIKELSKKCLGERADDFEQMLEAPSPTHEFWKTRYGGAETKDALSDADIPILLTTGYNDFYVGGVFDMWNRMNRQTRDKSALLVSPYNHGDGYNREIGISFPNGQKRAAFGDDYRIVWLDNVRKGTPLPYKKGSVAYYRTFENIWGYDFYGRKTRSMNISLGQGKDSFTYDPSDPPAFRGEGLVAEEFLERKDVLSIFTPDFLDDTFVLGKMKMKLFVSTNCEDTSFYVRISLKKSDYTYVLRHDITSLCYQLGDYEAGSVAELEFSFDEYAFLVKQGESLRVDISSTDDNVYVCHTNRKGEYYTQNDCLVAKNTVYLEKSYLTIPIEE